jgi:hypothetical protein
MEDEVIVGIIAALLMLGCIVFICEIWASALKELADVIRKSGGMK